MLVVRTKSGSRPVRRKIAGVREAGEAEAEERKREGGCRHLRHLPPRRRGSLWGGGQRTRARGMREGGSARSKVVCQDQRTVGWHRQRCAAGLRGNGGGGRAGAGGGGGGRSAGGGSRLGARHVGRRRFHTSTPPQLVHRGPDVLQAALLGARLRLEPADAPAKVIDQVGEAEKLCLL